MLGGEAAIERAHDLVHGVHQLVIAGEKRHGIGVLGLHQIEMDIAVAEMTERDAADARHEAFANVGRAADQLRHFGHRHRDVVLDRGAGQFLRLGMLLAEFPERGALRATLGDDGVENDTRFHRRREHLFERGAQPRAFARCRQFDQRVLFGRRRDRQRGAGDVAQHEIDPGARHVFIGLDRRGVVLLESVEQIERRLRGGERA